MFPNGLPGAGLLLLRVVCSVVVAARALPTIVINPHDQTLLLQSVALATAVLLLVGLWTPIAGLLIVFIELWFAVGQTNDIQRSLLLAAIGAALAALGPGAHSVDARLYGRKRVQIRAEE